MIQLRLSLDLWISFHFRLFLSLLLSLLSLPQSFGLATEPSWESTGTIRIKECRYKGFYVQEIVTGKTMYLDLGQLQPLLWSGRIVSEGGGVLCWLVRHFPFPWKQVERLTRMMRRWEEIQFNRPEVAVVNVWRTCLQHRWQQRRWRSAVASLKIGPKLRLRKHMSNEHDVRNTSSGNTRAMK